MKKFLILLFITFAIALFPTVFIDFNTDYLIKPALFPPKIVFPITWSILYLLMTISVYLTSKNDDNILKIYFAQLIVNALWSPLFFGFKFYLIALFWLILLIILVAIMILKMLLNNKFAAYLQIPYFLWLLFATYLNLAVYLLN
jgi:tryptophan-rich sensory protein